MCIEAKGLYANFPKDEFLHVDKASRVNADEVAKGVAAFRNALSKVIFFSQSLMFLTIMFNTELTLILRY